MTRDDPGAAIVITVITGTAGVGKTALAVHWAHRISDRYPDGQLYVNLRGFDPTGTAVAPAEAIRGFLDAFGVTPPQIPLSLQAQAALYRSLLAGRRVLILLDNAAEDDQIRPLLPGSPGCLVIVTSRNELRGLIVTEGAHPVDLDLLSTAEARQLLSRRAGESRVLAELPAADDIIALCARLPLALMLVAARAAAHPGFRLAALAAELREAGGSLDAFSGQDQATNVRAVFAWSYLRLSTPARRLFRLLGLHYGPDISTPAVASLAGMAREQIRPALAELARAHLVTERVPGRFAFHDLLRAYATELAGAHDSDDYRRAARRRMLDHYLHSAYRADELLSQFRDRPFTLADAEAGWYRSARPTRNRRWPGSSRNTPCSSRPCGRPPDSTCTPGSSPGPWHPISATRDTGGTGGQASAPRSTPPGGCRTSQPRRFRCGCWGRRSSACATMTRHTCTSSTRSPCSGSWVTKRARPKPAGT